MQPNQSIKPKRSARLNSWGSATQMALAKATIQADAA